MKRIGLVATVLAAMVFGAMALAFEAYFSDAAGNKIGKVWEGRYVYIAVKDPEKGACGIDEFEADILIFDFKTGAYIMVVDDPATPAFEGAVFRELGGIGSGLYFWVDGPGSNRKVSVQIGSRADFTSIPYGMTHVLDSYYASPTPPAWAWLEGAWEYVDQNTFSSSPWPAPGNPVPTLVELPRDKQTARVNFEGLTGAVNALPAGGIAGRFENNDTLVLIVREPVNPMNVDQDQVKIVDTVAKLKVTPTIVSYGCGPACENIVVRIEDPDENLNPNEIEYVPFFVIVNPGSWNPQTSGINNFCTLMMRGSLNDTASDDLMEPIRWYNIYDEPVPATVGTTTVYSRWILYPQEWLSGKYTIGTTKVGRALFFAAETAVDSGVFEFNFGNLEELQEALGFAKFPPYTTITFYYIDPNDFDDMDLAAIYVNTNKYHSQTWITDANGVPVSEVKIGHGGLYIRVYDADANQNACCQDKIVVHICNPHNEDDSEYIVIDEISNNSGIFFTASGIRLEPVWDAVNGYQLVFDDWKVQAFNEDTIFVRYNSVDYEQEDLNLLGDGDPTTGFPPAINEDAARNQYWDVSFAKVKVYDFQVFDGETHHMRFLDGEYKPVTEIPVSGSLYLEVTDLDQNENPLLRELIFGGWNKDAYSGDDGDREYTTAIGSSQAEDDGTTPSADANEDSAPIWWKGDSNANGTSADPNSDVMTPQGAVSTAPYLKDTSISGIAETVKIFMFNAQNGNWERIDLRETAVGSGVFRSTVCVLVADSRHPGDGNLGSAAGDTIMAFYQDPSNHSDVSIISIKVSEGGAGAVTPPTVQLSVVFDKTTYYPGDTVTITVTDEQYAGAAEIVGTNVLVLLDKDGKVITSWNKLEAVAGQPGKFRVTYVLPETVKLGTITAKYTDPYMTTRTAQGQATVVAKALSNVAGITISPNPFQTSTTFTIQAEPAGAVAEKITITIYDLTGAKVAVVSGENTASVTWDGGNLRNGAYIYVAVVEGGTKAWTFKGFVYI
ncbi:MAG: T9SS type A sorting domain-containing protein, partial [Methanomassiliicoccales archaeon]|nr:T9SS type A sorting domain-containing protein [Methanomassiliicoccales archaeon]